MVGVAEVGRSADLSPPPMTCSMPKSRYINNFPYVRSQLHCIPNRQIQSRRDERILEFCNPVPKSRRDDIIFNL